MGFTYKDLIGLDNRIDRTAFEAILGVKIDGEIAGHEKFGPVTQSDRDRIALAQYRDLILYCRTTVRHRRACAAVAALPADELEACQIETRIYLIDNGFHGDKPQRWHDARRAERRSLTERLNTIRAGQIEALQAAE